jgi:nucleotide-binding universal stress UspA family protein
MAVPIGYGPGGPLPTATSVPAVDEERVLATLSRVAAERLAGIDFDLRAIQHGSPSTALCSLAEVEEVDLIAVGTAGRRGIRRLLLGSVAEAVVRHAPCSVLVARPVEPRRATT